MFRYKVVDHFEGSLRHREGCPLEEFLNNLNAEVVSVMLVDNGYKSMRGPWAEYRIVYKEPVTESTEACGTTAS